jgi:hypothetical protein
MLQKYEPSSLLEHIVATVWTIRTLVKITQDHIIATMTTDATVLQRVWPLQCF